MQMISRSPSCQIDIRRSTSATRMNPRKVINCYSPPCPNSKLIIWIRVVYSEWICSMKILWNHRKSIEKRIFFQVPKDFFRSSRNRPMNARKKTRGKSIRKKNKQIFGDNYKTYKKTEAMGGTQIEFKDAKDEWCSERRITFPFLQKKACLHAPLTGNELLFSSIIQRTCVNNLHAFSVEFAFADLNLFIKLALMDCIWENCAATMQPRSQSGRYMYNDYVCNWTIGDCIGSSATAQPCQTQFYLVKNNLALGDRQRDSCWRRWYKHQFVEIRCRLDSFISQIYLKYRTKPNLLIIIVINRSGQLVASVIFHHWYLLAQMLRCFIE